MRSALLLVGLILMTGCMYQMELQIPEVHVEPKRIGHSGHISVRLWGAEIADYRFMGAIQEPDGRWRVRLDPVWLGVIAQESTVTVAEGEQLPLGPRPSVLVEFVRIAPTELELRATAIYSPDDPYGGPPESR